MDALPLETLREGSPEDRTAAAGTVRSVAERSPERLRGSLGRLTAALDDEVSAVRRDVVAALAILAEENPASVAPVAERLVTAVDDDETEAVRSDAARAVADLAEARPERARFAAEVLVGSLTAPQSVRRETARAVAALAPRYPETLREHFGPLRRALLDDYAPVAAAVLRAFTPLERAYPGTLDAAHGRLRAFLSADAAGVRQAACYAVAANRPPWARTELQSRCHEERHPVVRESARAALTTVEADGGPSGRVTGTTAEIVESVTIGTWVVARLAGSTVPLVGRVTAVVRDESETDAETRRSRGLGQEAFDSRDAFLAAPRVAPSGERAAVHLHNPFAGSGGNLLRGDDGVTAEVVDPTDGTASLKDVTAVHTVSADRARLLAARPGDELAFELEGAAYAVTVSTVGEVDGTYRVVGANADRGHELSFRPFGQNPLMAVFEKGRAFRAENVQLNSADTD